MIILKSGKIPKLQWREESNKKINNRGKQFGPEIMRFCTKIPLVERKKKKKRLDMRRGDKCTDSGSTAETWIQRERGGDGSSLDKAWKYKVRISISYQGNSLGLHLVTCAFRNIVIALNDAWTHKMRLLISSSTQYLGGLFFMGLYEHNLHLGKLKSLLL